MKFMGNLWKSMGIRGNPLKSLEIYSNPCKSKGIHVNPLTFIAIHLKSIEIHEAIHGNSKNKAILLKYYFNNIEI